VGTAQAVIALATTQAAPVVPPPTYTPRPTYTSPPSATPTLLPSATTTPLPTPTITPPPTATTRPTASPTLTNDAGLCFGQKAIATMSGEAAGSFYVGGGYVTYENGVPQWDRYGAIVIVGMDGGVTLKGTHFDKGAILRVNKQSQFEVAPVGTRICVTEDVKILGTSYSKGAQLVVVAPNRVELAK
jgi:hypothetical protein